MAFTDVPLFILRRASLPPIKPAAPVATTSRNIYRYYLVADEARFDALRRLSALASNAADDMPSFRGLASALLPLGAFRRAFHSVMPTRAYIGDVRLQPAYIYWPIYVNWLAARRKFRTR